MKTPAKKPPAKRPQPAQPAKKGAGEAPKRKPPAKKPAKRKRSSGKSAWRFILISWFLPSKFSCAGRGACQSAMCWF